MWAMRLVLMLVCCVVLAQLRVSFSFIVEAFHACFCHSSYGVLSSAWVGCQLVFYMVFWFENESTEGGTPVEFY
jgi:hypothetical protein